MSDTKHTKEREELRNEISRIRYDVVRNGSTIVTPDRYDALQKEWILRCGDELQQQRITDLERQLADMEKAWLDAEVIGVRLERQLAEAQGKIEQIGYIANGIQPDIMIIEAIKALAAEESDV